MRQIVFVNRYFFPDLSATSRLLSDLAFELAGPGAAITVITSRQRYDSPGAALPRREKCNGVQVQRVAGTRFGRRALSGRMVDYVTFGLALGWALLRTVRRGDVVVFKTDPPMLGPLLAPVARLRGARVINWLQDLFPQVAIAAGVIGTRAGSVLTRICTRGLKRADQCVCVGDSMADALARMGITSTVIDNWVDLDALRAGPDEIAALRKAWGINEARFVVAYSGNLGRAHPIAALKDAITQLAGEPQLLFLFTGGGVGYDELARWSRAQRYDHIMFQPYQPEERLPALLGIGDVHLALLAPEYEGLIVPSKFSGIAAAGRCCLFVGSAQGQIGRWIDAADCGQIVEEGASLAPAILALKNDQPKRHAMGLRARQLAEATFGRARAVRRWRQLLEHWRGLDAEVSS